MTLRWAILLLAVASGCAAPTPVSRVVVRDTNLAVMRTMTDPAAVAAFVRQWDGKTEATPPTAPQYAYRLDLQAPDTRGVRWFYDPSGWAEPLATKGGPVYRIADPTRLNAILELSDIALPAR